MQDVLPVDDEAIPALTSRFLLLLDDGQDILELKPKQNVRKPSTITKLEESKQPEEPPALVTSYINKENNGGTIFKNSSPVWSSLPKFDKNPAYKDFTGLPSIPPCPLPNPSTPKAVRSNVNLFASFSSSPISRDSTNMWQYSNKNKVSHPLLSPQTTDAVGGANAKKAAEALWQSPRESQKHLERSNGHKPFPSNYPPIAPSLMVDDTPANNHSRTQDRPPLVIMFQNRTYNKDYYAEQCLGGVSYDDSDEVSLLADDPDEDDDGVLPPSTYDVVVNILDEIDRDGNENDVTNANIEWKAICGSISSNRECKPSSKAANNPFLSSKE